MAKHECSQEDNIENIDKKLEKIELKIDQLDQKLDDKLEAININLADHMKRTAILETRQENHEKTMQEVISIAKKGFWYLIVFFFLYMFKDNQAVLDVLKSLLVG